MEEIPEIVFEEYGVLPALKRILENDISECYRLGMWKEYNNAVNNYLKMGFAQESRPVCQDINSV
ncbi:MAG: hypothetical protein JW789_01035 [Candidatus Aenigmarchaeota archaeon]|nr:hypothetical protein [Candidatus Aenigmarchaeota archaeon]